MNVRQINAANAPVASGGYSQAVEVRGAARRLYISGQIPVDRDGRLPKKFDEQADLVWQNLIAQLCAADMSIQNLVKITIFLGDRKFAAQNSAIRRDKLGGHKPALTVVIAGIFDEKWLLEIEAIAESFEVFDSKDRQPGDAGP